MQLFNLEQLAFAILLNFILALKYIAFTKKKKEWKIEIL